MIFLDSLSKPFPSIRLVLFKTKISLGSPTESSLPTNSTDAPMSQEIGAPELLTKKVYAGATG